MKRIALIAGLLITFSAFANVWDNWPWADLEDENHLRELFRDYSDLLDPFSVQFRNIRVRTGVTDNGTQMTIWCGLSNQKNRMGAYGGWADFYAVEGLDEPKVDVALGDTAKITMVMVALFCDGSHGERTDVSLIKLLQSPSPEVRTKASKSIYYAKFDDARFMIVGEQVYEAVATAIRNQLATLNKESPRQQQEEVAWHAEALAASGNLDYMPLLDELSRSPVRKVARHAKKAKKLLAKTANRK
jgi:hypothetical protein